jgi:hypothetical protein
MNSPEYQSNLGSPAPSMSADEGSNSGGGEEEGEEIGEDQRVLSREDVKGMCARDIRLREREQQVCVPSPPHTHTYLCLIIFPLPFVSDPFWLLTHPALIAPFPPSSPFLLVCNRLRSLQSCLTSLRAVSTLQSPALAINSSSSSPPLLLLLLLLLLASPPSPSQRAERQRQQLELQLMKQNE